MDTVTIAHTIASLGKMREGSNRAVMKVVIVNRCILTESSDRGDSILVRT